MNKLRGALKSHVFERPFDLYTAFVLFVAGIYGLVDDSWPERFGSGFVYWIIHIISLYFMIASAMIMASLLCRRKKHPVLAFMGEMYGWLFVSAASMATVLAYISALWYADINNIWVWLIFLFIWLGMSVASGVRFLDLWHIYKEIAE